MPRSSAPSPLCVSSPPQRNYFARTVLLERAKRMRSQPTASEAKMWFALRRSSLGAKFRRQHIVGNVILDFYCASARLCIEIDGARHFNVYQRALDALRDEGIRAWGVRTLRFTASEVERDLSSVLARIRAAL